MRPRRYWLTAAVLATVAVNSSVTSPAQAASPQYLFKTANSPVNAWKHVYPASPVIQTVGGAAWSVDQTGVDQDGVAQYRIFNTSVVGTKCLDVTDGHLGVGTSLTMTPCLALSPSSTQNWRLVRTLANGKSAVKLLHNRSGLIAGVRDGSTAEDAIIELQTDEEQNSQKFFQQLLPVGT